MNIWQDTPPRAEGWYLCAWAKGDGHVYLVGKWDGAQWITSMTAEPELWQEISSPKAQEEMLNELYKASK